MKANNAGLREEQVVVKLTDMSTDLVNDVVSTTLRAMDEIDLDAGIAKRIRQRLESRFPNSVWNIVIGRAFACSITHELNHAIYFYVGPKAFYIFKSS